MGCFHSLRIGFNPYYSCNLEEQYPYNGTNLGAMFNDIRELLIAKGALFWERYLKL